MTIEHRFVDRERELEIFRHMIAGEETRRVLDICAGSGTGKSWLLRRMAWESNQTGLPCALAEFASSWQPGPVKLMRELAERLGADRFPAFSQQDAILHSQPPTGRGDQAMPPDVILEGKFAGAHIGPVAARDLYQWTVEQRRPPTAAEVERIEHVLSSAFCRELQALAADRPAALLLDACEYIPAETAAWLTRRLLGPMRDRPGAWGRLVVVLAGRPSGSRPTFEPWADWQGLVCALDRLSDLEERHVRVFFQRYGLHLEAAEFAFAYRLCKARPLNMASIVEELLGGRP